MKQFLYCVFYTSLTTLFYWYIIKCPTTGIDDANIYFTYAKNLVEGHGLVYNVGGERVEGFTSVIWMLICAFCYWLSPEYLVLTLSLLNVLIISALVFKAVKLLNRFNGKKHFFNLQSILFLGLLAMTPGVFEWNVLSLMETGLWTLGIFLLFYWVLECASGRLSDKYLLSFLPLFVLIRPENIAWSFMCTVLVFGFFYLTRGKVKSILKLPLLIILVSFMSLALLIFWRLYYFGYPFPNTYYAKVSTDLFYNLKEGFEYLIKFLVRTPIATISLALVPLALKIGVKQFQKGDYAEINVGQLLLCMFILTGLFVPILSGGDHFLLGRFYQPVIPLLLLLLLNTSFWKQFFSVGFKASLKNRWSDLYLVLAVFAVSFLAHSPLPNYLAGLLDSSSFKEFEYVRKSKEMSRHFEILFSDLKGLPYAAKQAVGGFGFFYKGKVFDVYGLNDVEMAHAETKKYGNKNHAAFHIPTFLKKHPDVFRFYFLDKSRQSSIKPQNISDPLSYLKGLFQNDDFKKNYKEVMISQEGFDKVLVTFASKSFIEELTTNGQYEIKPIY